MIGGRTACAVQGLCQSYAGGVLTFTGVVGVRQIYRQGSVWLSERAGSLARRVMEAALGAGDGDMAV